MIEIVNKTTANLPTHPVRNLTVSSLDETPNAIKAYTFGYATPAGNENALINTLQFGDLVYLSDVGTIKKVKVQSLNATLKKSRVFPVLYIKDNARNWFDSKDFTAIEGVVGCIFKPNIELIASELYLHDENGSSADIRVPFNYAVHCGSGGCLEGLVKPLSFLTLDLVGAGSVPDTICFTQ